MKYWFCSILLSVFFVQLGIAQCAAAWGYEDDGLSISFLNQSTSQAGDPINSFAWDFGDGSSSTEENPVHIYQSPDEYWVCLTITTQNGCTDQVCAFVEHCLLTIDATIGEDCDENDEITLNVTINDVYDQAREINVFLDGILVQGSPFDIRDDEPVTLNLLVPGDGQPHTLTVESTRIGHCTTIFDFNTFDCAGGCFLNNMAVGLTGGAMQLIDVGGNFFSPANTTITIGDVVRFNWIDGGHSSTSDATSGPDSWNTGVIGLGSVFDLTLTNPGVHPYYCIPHGGPGGAGMSGQIIANCPSSGVFDVVIDFNTGVANPAGFNLKIDGVIQSGSPFAYTGVGQNTISIQMTGDGLNHEITIEDVAVPTCSSTRNFLAPDCGAAPSCSVSVSALETGGCNGNMEVPVQLTISSINGGANGFNILIDGGLIAGPIGYDLSGTTIVDILIQGDGASHTILIQDIADSNCNGSTAITTQNCAIQCQLSNLILNSGTSFTHIVEVQDFQFIPQNITISSGDVVQFNWTGQVAHTSTSDVQSGPDSWDSGLLNSGATYTTQALSEGVHPYYCIPHGAPGGIGMSGTISVQANCTNGQVSVQLTFNALGEGFNGYEILVDNIVSPGGAHAYDADGMNTNTVLVPGDGQSHTIEIRDVDNPGCNVSSSIVTPDCNASTCQITATASEVGGCTNNQVLVEVQVTDIGGGLSGFTVDLDGVNQGTFNYDATGTTIVNMNIEGDGQVHSIDISDIDDPACTASATITTTDCTIPCTLIGLTLSTGSTATHTVEVRDFEFFPQNISITSGDVVEFSWTGQVAHTSTSDATSGLDSWDSGLLNSGATFTTPVLSEGVHPYYCIPHGGPGGVGMAGTISVLADCDNGQVSVLITFSEAGGGAGGYEILVDGIVASVGAQAYDISGMNEHTVLVPGDGQSHTIEIRDVDNPACTVSSSIVTPDCNASTCQITATASEVGGCTNNQVLVEVQVTDIGGGLSGFTVDLDGVNQGAFNYDATGTTIVNMNIEGDGQVHSIDISDIDDPACTASATITTTDCTIPCTLIGLTLSTGSTATHTVEVRDFEFFPQNISITSGDVVEFSWTGQVAHTSTSDATSGLDSWDSGLLNSGATFTTPVLSEGVHPYYCIPHGGPGGVGMAGTISVLADCDNGQVSVLITFSEAGGGAGGYEILIDGIVASVGAQAYDISGMNEHTVLVPGDGQSHTIEIRDVDNPGCNVSGSIVTPDCNASTCQLLMSSTLASGCNDNGLIEIQIDIQDIGGSDLGFNLLVDGMIWSGSPFLYDPSGNTSVLVNLAGDGLTHAISIQDIADAACLSGTSITVPDCSQDCQILSASVTFGTAAIHTVEVLDFEFSPQSIIVGVGDTVRFIWTGSVAHTTTSDAESGPDSWDSGLLNTGAEYDIIITEAGIHPYYCIPHGAPGGIGMSGIITAFANCENGNVQGSLTFQHSGQSGAGYQVYVDGNLLTGSPFSYVDAVDQMANIQIPGDGQSHLVLIQDADFENCSTSVNITTPDCNASICQLNMNASIAGPCNVAYQVPVEITVISTGGGEGGFNLLVDGLIEGGSPYAYSGNDTTMISLTLPGNGEMHSIFIFDIDDVSCTATATIATPNCTQTCDISYLQIEIAGSAAVHSVEVKDFEFSPQDIQVAIGDTVRFLWTGVVPHTTTSDATSGLNSWDSGLLGQNATFDVVIQSAGVHHYYCIPHGAPGGIGMAGTITASEPCSNQMIDSEICFTHQGTSLTGYHIFIDGLIVTGGPFPYQPDGMTCQNILLPADGLDHSISIQDADLSACLLDTVLFFPDCENPCFFFEASFNWSIDEVTQVVEFTNSTSIEADSFVWHFGDGTLGFDINPIHDYNEAGSYTVCLEAYQSNICADTTCQTLFIGAYVCDAAFIYESDGLTVNFLNTSVTTDSITNIQWTFGDGTVINQEDQVLHSYNELGLYTVCLTIQADTCIQTVCEEVDMSNPCHILTAGFEMVIDGSSVQLEDQSTGNVESWLWGFGDGTTSTDSSPTYIYNAPGQYTVCLLVFDLENNCSDFKCVDISIVVTSVTSPDIKSLLIYPNPMYYPYTGIKIVGFESSELEQEYKVRLLDITGREMETKIEELPGGILQLSWARNLPGGSYVIQMITEKSIYTGKLIIHH